MQGSGGHSAAVTKSQELSGGSAWKAQPPAPTASAASSPSPVDRLHEQTGA